MRVLETIEDKIRYELGARYFELLLLTHENERLASELDKVKFEIGELRTAKEDLQAERKVQKPNIGV